jgi:anti-sigma28 factor (negative regulator of flagellin synthesis)
MKINGTASEALRPSSGKPVGGAKGTPADAPKSQPTSGGAPRSDSVQISDVGRALSTGSPSLSAERVAELRKRVLEGAYNTTHVVDQVAKRILERGDV